MHLCNNNAKRFAADFKRFGIKDCVVRTYTATPIQTNADFLLNGEQTVEVNLDKLRKEYKRPVWEWIKANQPELAKLLGDAEFSDLTLQFKQTFNATVSVRLPESAAKKIGLIR